MPFDKAKYYKSQLMATGFDQSALYFMQSGIRDKSEGTKIFGAVLGGFAYYSVGSAMEQHGLGKSNGTWNVLSTVAGTVIGYFAFNEEITQKQMLGIGLGIVALYLMDGVSETKK